MANTSEDIVINIEISYAEAIKGITELQTANENLQKNLTELKKSVDNNSVSQEEYAKSAAATKVAIQQNNETIRIYQKEIRNNIKAEKDNGDSLVALRAKLSNLTKEYDNLSAAERSAGKGQDLQNKINQITTSLNNAEQETQCLSQR